MKSLLLNTMPWMNLWGSSLGRREVTMFRKGHSENVCVAGNGLLIDLGGDYMVVHFVIIPNTRCL